MAEFDSLHFLSGPAEVPGYARIQLSRWKSSPMPVPEPDWLSPDSRQTIPSSKIPLLLTQIFQEASWTRPETGLEQLFHLKSCTPACFSPLFFQAILQFSMLYDLPLEKPLSLEDLQDPACRQCAEAYLSWVLSRPGTVLSSVQMDLMKSVLFEPEEPESWPVCWSLRKPEEPFRMPELMIPEHLEAEEPARKICLIYRRQKLYFFCARRLPAQENRLDFARIRLKQAVLDWLHAPVPEPDPQRTAMKEILIQEPGAAGFLQEAWENGGKLRDRITANPDLTQLNRRAKETFERTFFRGQKADPGLLELGYLVLSAEPENRMHPDVFEPAMDAL